MATTDEHSVEGRRMLVNAMVNFKSSHRSDGMLAPLLSENENPWHESGDSRRSDSCSTDRGDRGGGRECHEHRKDGDEPRLTAGYCGIKEDARDSNWRPLIAMRS